MTSDIWKVGMLGNIEEVGSGVRTREEEERPGGRQRREG